jgi:hypothetical protein
MSDGYGFLYAFYSGLGPSWLFMIDNIPPFFASSNFKERYFLVRSARW